MYKSFARQIETRLTTSKIGRTLHCLDEVDSTNRWALDLAKEGGAHGEVVIADSQTSGRGRLGRSWFSPPGKNLYLSIVLKPNLFKEAPELAPVAGEAVCLGLTKLTGKEFLVKWPNDIMADGKKLGGILCESVMGKKILKYLVIGIGINVNMAGDDFPCDLREDATSLKEVTGREIDRAAVTAAILNSFEPHYERFLESLR